MSFKKKFFIFILLLVAFFVFFIYMVLWKGSTSFAFINSTETVDKVRQAEKLGDSIELQEKDINSILGVYIGKGRTNAGATVKGVNVTFDEDNLTFKIPIIYKGIHFLISTSGKCIYLPTENKIEYKSDYYKIGSMPISKTIVENMLRKHENKNFKVTDSSIEVSVSMFGFSINKITFNKDNILLSLNKNNVFDIIFPKLPNPTTSDSGQIKNPTNTVEPNTKNPTTEIDNSVVPKSPSSEINKPKDPKPSSDAKASLDKISSELSNATSSLKNANEKEVLQRIINTLNLVSSNSSYNYASDVANVTSIYHKLPLESRNRVKLAIMSNVDIDAAVKLKNTFGF